MGELAVEYMETLYNLVNFSVNLNFSKNKINFLKRGLNKFPQEHTTFTRVNWDPNIGFSDAEFCTFLLHHTTAFHNSSKVYYCGHILFPKISSL